LSTARNSCGAGGNGVPAWYFSRNYLVIIKGWNGLTLSLTYRKDEFAEDLSEEGKQTLVAGRNDKKCRQPRDVYKKPRTPASD
jgi:hypothetical protein